MHEPRIQLLVSVCLTMLLAAGGGRPLSAAQPSDEELRGLVQALGSPKFVEREHATQHLLQLGAAALPSLSGASQDPDREVRARARRIGQLIRQRIRTQQIEAFRDGRPMAEEFGRLPGWDAFSQRYGDEPETRRVFAEMLQSDWDLWSGVYAAEPPPPVRRLMIERLYHLQLRNDRTVPLGTALSLFVIAADFPAEATVHRHLHDFTLRAQLRNALQPGADPPLARRIVGTWIATAAGGDLEQLGLNTAIRFALPEGVVLARRTLENQATAPAIKSMAMQVVAELGEKPQADVLLPFLDDASVLTRGGRREKQLRDVALACLVYMHGYDLEKIGVRLMPGRRRLFDPSSVGYESDEDRLQALQYWRDQQATAAANPAAEATPE